MMDYVENKPLAEIFNLSPEEFADVSVFSLPFSIRILNRFWQNSIYTVKDLLLVDISFLKDIPGFEANSLSRVLRKLLRHRHRRCQFGANSLSQVLDHCEGLSKSNVSGMVTVRPKEKVSSLFVANKDAIALGDFSFADGLDLSADQKKQLEAYKSAYEDLGEDIVFDCICSPEKIAPLVEALSTIANRCLTLKKLKKLEKYYYQIPSLRRNNAAKYYIDAYSYDENTRSLLTKCYSSPDDVLGAIIYSINAEDSAQVIMAEQFLKWCMFDLPQEIAELFDKIYTAPRIQTVIEGRARGLTLNDLGKQLGITRERVRQIEAKAKSRFVRQAGRLKIMSKLYADQNGQSIITLEDVESVSGKNASALIYLLKDSKGSAYTYDHKLDAFVIGDNDFSSRIQDYIDSLPDVLHKADYADALKTAHEEYDLDTEYVVKAINEVYKTTGDVLHRSRLSLAKIYDAILRKYYSAGIHVYDDNEIDDLRQHIYTDYGIKLPSSNRAIATRISRICMLAGRGIYIPKKEKWISAELAQKLLSYIMDSENPILFIGNVFSVFEEELVKEGIDNRFYLQGVLRELFGDKLYFRRDYVSKDKSFTSIYSSIVAFIKGAKYLVKKDELKIQFKGITDVVIALATSDSDILNYYGEYLHASKLVIRETEKNYLNQYLASLLADGEAHHIKDIYDDINRDRPELFSRNAVIRPYSAFSVIEYLFREQYQFSRPYIALNSVEIGNPNERLLELLYSMDQFNVTDITEFAKDNHMLIQALIDFINSLNDKYLLVDVDTLISIDEIGVNSSIAAEVETLICNEISDTMPIRELQCVSRFPQINVTWNEWLVYSILKKWSTKLDVALSSSQLRQSIPLVSIAGKMDASKYKDVSTEPVHIKVDNMDDIEENTQQEKDKMRDSIPQNSDETLSEEEMEDDSNMDQFLGSMSVQGDFKCALKKALEDIEEGKFYFKDCFAVNKLTLGAISNIIKERMAPDQTKINEIQAKIKEIEESTKKRIKAIAKGEYDRFIKVGFGKTTWATMSEEQKAEVRSKLAEQELDAMNEEIMPFTKQIEDLQNTSDAKRVISIVLESLKDKSLSSLDMIDKTFEKAKMSDSSESEKDKMRDSIPQNSEKTPMVNEIPSEEGMEDDSNSDPLPARSFDAEFYNWLCNTEGMAVYTCRDYVWALHTAEKYAKEHGFKTTDLCTKDSDVSLATASALMQNADFRKFNQKMHYNFSAAFQKLNRFFAYLHPEKFGMIPPIKRIPAEPASEKKSSESISPTLPEAVDTLIKGSFDAEFYNWLCNTEGMAVSTCRLYVLSLHTAEKYAKEHGFKTTVLCTKDSDVSLATASALMQNADFRKFNQEKHRNFSAAFQKLNRFFAYLHPEKFGMIPPIKRIPAEPVSEKGGCIEQKYRQPQWNIYEAAILLDGYLETLQKKEPKTHTIKRISDALRTMAVNQGISIDSVYRNENGISYQLQSMESAYLGRKGYVPAMRLFQEIVQLYQNNHEKYLEILIKAKGMVAAKPNNKEAFLAWAATIVSAGKYKWVDSNISRVKQFGINTKQISGSIYDVTDLKTLDDLLKSVRKSKIFRINNRKHYNQILADFSLYIRYCLQREKEVESTDSIDSTAEVDKTGITTTTVSQDTGGFMLVNFCNIGDMAYTQPISFDYKGAHSTSNKWGPLYVELISKLRIDYPAVFVDAADKTVFQADALMIASENNKSKLRAPRAIGDGYYIEVNCPTTRIIRHIRSFLDLCRVDYSQVSIRYRRTTDQEQEDNLPAEKNAESLVDSGIVSVLMQHYQYGFRYESIRELIRFRQFAGEMCVPIPDDDELLKAAILASGTLIDDKVYCKNDNLPYELRTLVASAFDTGAEVIYYECLFHRESEWMASHIITSDSMLKEYLQKHIGGCSFSKKLFNKGTKLTEKAAVTEEIKRVWGEQQIESVEELSNRLPYIPLGNIQQVISGNDLFVLSSKGVYVLLDRFRITEDEEEDILEYVSTACEQNGFASLSDVPLGDIEEVNYELSQLAIYNAIYKKVLSHKYHLNGKILTIDKPELDAITLLKKYIAGRDSCSFDEVAEKVIELTGGSNRHYAFQALYDDMVRTGPNSFVSNTNVSFNVDEIDRILSVFITDHFLAIRDITTFAMFPVSGQSWNHYLLESYCYKYSRKYSLHVLHFNDKNAGIIVEKEYDRQYAEMLAIALVREGVELSPEAAGLYLFNAGYIAKSKYARLGEIIQRAKEIRGMR